MHTFAFWSSLKHPKINKILAKMCSKKSRVAPLFSFWMDKNCLAKNWLITHFRPHVFFHPLFGGRVFQNKIGLIHRIDNTFQIAFLKLTALNDFLTEKGRNFGFLTNLSISPQKHKNRYILAHIRIRKIKCSRFFPT